jgi:lysophospholipase L1-like esterase
MIRFTLLALSALLFVPALHAEDAKPDWKWEKDVARIEGYNEKAPKGAIVFVGSSSISSWGDLPTSFPGLTVLKRGFGGSVVADQIRALPRIVLPIAPKVVAYYCGDNNVTSAKSDPQVAVDGFVTWLDSLQEALPGTQVVYLAIKPSPSRKAAWPVAQEANKRIQAICEQRKGVVFADVATVLLTETGEMRPELYKPDALHMNAEGYALWIPVLDPLLKAGLAAADAAK